MLEREIALNKKLQEVEQNLSGARSEADKWKELFKEEKRKSGVMEQELEDFRAS